MVRNIGKFPPQDWGSSTKLQLASDRKTFIYLLWLYHLPDEEVVSVCKRLKLSESLRKNIQATKKIVVTIPQMEKALPSQIYQELEDISPLALYVASLMIDSSGVEILEKYILTWKNISPNTTGDDLRKRGLPPSQIYQKILGRLRAAWLDGEVKSPEEENALLEKIIDYEQ
jgi:tRNA nucleotidyltransferase (CCA-adding enzyme)